MPKQLSLDSARHHIGRGGPRLGAGRPRGERPRVLHRCRERFMRPRPLHVTVRVRSGVPSLRRPRFVRRCRVLLSQACARDGFRIVHYSIQRDHIHLLVEGASHVVLSNGMKSFGARVGKLVNRLWGRCGRVLDGRYHARLIGTPLEARRALAYVLLNARRHWMKRYRRLPPARLDAASSARWFDGWASTQAPPPTEPCEVAPAQTWLLRVGWRRHGLIALNERPR